MSKFSSFLRVFLGSGIVVLLAVAAIWRFGPKLGLEGSARLIVCVALVVVWVVFLVVGALIRWSRARRSARLRRGTAPSAADVSGAEAEFKERLARTIQWLKKSKLARSGSDAVYDLPWYLIVGPEGSGKTSLIVQSKLDIHYTDPKKVVGETDILPTENCDLWVSNEALLIDASGKYLNGESLASWGGILDQIVAVRKAKPLDGMVLVVDPAQVLEASDQAMREIADRIRSRLDMVMHKTGMVLPIYLVFSKCDGLDGFVDYFDSSEEGVGQALGATFEEKQYRSPHPEEEFLREYDQIHDSLLGGRTARLATLRDAPRSKVIGFPSQLPLVRDQLANFVGILFQPNKFRERPIFRGFYFTSSSQVGERLDPLGKLLGSKTDVTRSAPSVPPGHAESYFIHPLLTRVVFPDHGLAGLSPAVMRRNRLHRMIVAGLCCVVLPLLFLLLASGAYRDNRSLTRTVNRARQLTVAIGDKSPDTLAVLKSLRTNLARVEECNHYGLRRRFHWGLHVGDDYVDKARALYGELLRRSFLERVGNSLEYRLRQITGDPEDAEHQVQAADIPISETYSLLKSYLMLSTPRRANETYLTSQLSPVPTSEYWFEGTPTDGPEAGEASQQLAFYVHQLAEHPDSGYLVLTPDEAVVARAREVLLSVDPLSTYYEQIQLEGDIKADPITLARTLEGQNVELFDAGSGIDGTYTRDGWEAYAKGAIRTMSEEWQNERSWVLGLPASDLDPDRPGEERIDQRLEELYFEDYRQAWLDFLGGISIVRYRSLSAAAEAMTTLSDQHESPIAQVLQTVSRNTWEDLKPDTLASLVEQPPESQIGLSRDFDSIHDFVKQEGDQPSQLAQYLTALSGLRVDLTSFVDSGHPVSQIDAIIQSAEDALRTTNQLLVGFDPDTHKVVEVLLKQPVQHVISAANRVRPVGDSLDRRDRALTAGGKVMQKKKPIAGAVMSILEPYEGKDYDPGREMMHTNSASDGSFDFPSRVVPGQYKICALPANEEHPYCADVRVDSANSGRIFELTRDYSKLKLLGRKKLRLELKVGQ
jgi:type VI secretion system protein ImpL